MKRLVPFLFAITLGTASFGCAAATADSSTDESDVTAAATTRTVEASRDPSHELLASTWAVHSVGSPDELMVRVYELGGGDPAMNGTSLMLAIDGGPDMGFIWDLGANIRSVESVKVPRAGTITITGSQDTYDDATGELALVPYEATVVYRLDNGLDPRLAVTAGGQTSTVEPQTDAAATFLSRVYRITTLENDAVHARVFELGGGDPALNGDQLFLSLMSYPEVKTYDLELDVLEVERVTFGPSGEIRVEGREDTMSYEGEIGQKPFAYAVRFTMADDGPASRVSITAE